jgi:DNA-binding NtrC family response regulator
VAELLIVDDDTDLADLLAEVLTERGHRVRRASTGIEGLTELARQVPDLIVLDVEMPDLDGPAMAMRMYLTDRGLESVPIVLVSGIVDLRRVAARIGTPYFLGKPYSLEAVTRMCERALGERHTPHPATM